MDVPEVLVREPKSRFWFYRPEWYFDGWSPFYRGHDEYSRRTIMLGWPVTGRVVIAIGYCGDPGCYAESVAMIEDNEED